MNFLKTLIREDTNRSGRRRETIGRSNYLKANTNMNQSVKLKIRHLYQSGGELPPMYMINDFVKSLGTHKKLFGVLAKIRYQTWRS